MSSDTEKIVVLNGVKPLGQELGKGAYGRVFTVKHGGTIYAAKEVHSIFVECDGCETIIEKFMNECRRCSELSHPNIVSFKGIYYPAKANLPTMVMELMDDSLANHVKTRPDTKFERSASILHDVAEGLGYLHSFNPPIVHRDLSPNNVLLKYTGDYFPPVAKIADLGVARLVDAGSESTRSRLTETPGTSDFMPPESMGNQPKYDTSLDIFSYGGIMLHTLNSRWPTPLAFAVFDPTTREMKAFTEIKRRQEHLDRLVGEAAVLRPLILACLDNDASQRPSIAEVSEKILEFKESPCLVPALQSGCYDISWTNCADLPFHMYGVSAAVDENLVFVMAGSSPEDDVLHRVLCYDSNSNQWDELPPPGQYWGILHMIGGQLTILGGSETINDQPVPTDKVLTYDKDSKAWTSKYPNMTTKRCKPGVVTHLEHVIVMGGESTDVRIRDDIEVLNWQQPTQWRVVNVHLPEPMWAISLTISDGQIYIMGFSGATWRYCTAYQIPADTLVSSSIYQPTYSDIATELPSVPYWHATVIPDLFPPTIVGGCNSSGDICTSTIHMLHVAKKTWKHIGSLSREKCGVGVALIGSDKLLVIGGSTNPNCIDSALAYSTGLVEKGVKRPL